MKITVIGAGGFVGQRVCAQLAVDSDVALTCLDQVAFDAPSGATRRVGDFSDGALRAEATDGADAVILLAAILGGAAEADPKRARHVNLDVPLDLVQELRDRAPTTRFVFASTVAVFDGPFHAPVTDATRPAPSLLYGAQKLMMEEALSHAARRGWLDAVSLRPSGIVARDGVDAGLKSAFMSRLFWAVRRGEDITLPVAQDSQSWLASVESVAANFIHAAKLPDLGDSRAFTLPALSLTWGEVVAALHRRFPDSPAKVRFAPEPETVAMFGAYPALHTETADRLGFSRDADADALVANAMI